MNWSIQQTELIEWLKGYDGPKFHAIVSDPPYALISITKRFGKEGSAPAKEGEDGRYQRLSGGFMGQKWDGFDSLDQYQDWVSEWSKALIEKALFPGAVCLFFGGTRTFHHLAVGLERGGFEITDTLLWLHGQGFPKSHDISKGLDRAAGAERKVIGKKIRGDVQDAKARGVGYLADPANRNNTKQFGYGDEEITEPATPEAERWDGYGTALKPAWEPVFLCRAPRGNKTFAQLATEFGTGALNIDGTRISGTPGDGRWGKDVTTDVWDKMPNQEPGELKPQELNQTGRWPANFVLSHSQECVKVGEYEVEGRTINRWTEDMKPFGDAAGEEYESEEMPPETVERWACVPECAVRILDDQAGDVYGAGTYSQPLSDSEVTEAASNSTLYDLGIQHSKDSRRRKMKYANQTGGPSRFFYTSKASRSEKDKGLEDFFWSRVESGFDRVDFEIWELLDKKKRARGNIHPTVKPLDMIRYLATLVLPPNGTKSDHSDERRKWRILVPFSGSGSEVIGALQAGWDEAVGVEMDETYTEIADARIRANVGWF